MTRPTNQEAKNLISKLKFLWEENTPESIITALSIEECIHLLHIYEDANNEESESLSTAIDYIINH